MLSQNCNILAPTEVTHIPTNPRGRPDVLDIVITHNIAQVPSINVDADLSSDHLPLRFTLYGLRHGLPPLKTKINWNNFTHILNNHIQASADFSTTQ
ncbi:hypothetical protein X975_21984, partial [Stegodyphus mimosarum]